MDDEHMKGTTSLTSDTEPAFNALGIPSESMAAWMHLQGFFAAGEVTPCSGRNEWTSGKAKDKATAIRLCGDCPAKAACLDFSVINNEKNGIWGGIDRSKK